MRTKQIYSQLAVANKGTLLGPPLLKPGTGEFDMKLELPPSADSDSLFNKVLHKGKEVQINVSYHSHFPGDLEKEAHVWEITS